MWKKEEGSTSPSRSRRIRGWFMVAMITVAHIVGRQTSRGLGSRLATSYSMAAFAVLCHSNRLHVRAQEHDMEEVDAYPNHAGYVHVPSGDPALERPVQYRYELIRELPHDQTAFTQGLTFHNGSMYESTGQYGLSELRKVDLESGTVMDSRKIPGNRFGEGMCIWKDKIIQLTWKSGEGYIWDLERLAKLESFRYTTERNNEAWGITHNNTELFVSDGSAMIYVWDPETMQEKRRIVVTNSRGRPIDNINELEFVNGEILANVWFRKWIYRIDPSSGSLLGKIDFRDLYPESKEFGVDSVFNGIAVDQCSVYSRQAGAGRLDNVRLFVTGKLWPKLFEVRLRSLH
eukprot:gb/GECG01008143.1/.p1 GENE.gb/GECG01008143.1/~~gb/GECG01008143.1/.p1  ORF type:complete len:346 (+),score=32.27 gb/GECG01008143.1/:1-1038(+)